MNKAFENSILGCEFNDLKEDWKHEQAKPKEAKERNKEVKT